MSEEEIIIKTIYDMLSQNKKQFEEIGVYIDLGKTEQNLVLSLLDLYNKQKEIIKAYENKIKERKTIINNDLDMGSKEYFARMEEIKEFEKIGKETIN